MCARFDDGCILHPSRCVYHGCVRTRRACWTGASLRCRIRVQRRRRRPPPTLTRALRSTSPADSPLARCPRTPALLASAPRLYFHPGYAEKFEHRHPTHPLSRREPQSLEPSRRSAAAAVAHLRILTIRKNPRSCARARHLVPVREREREEGGLG